jgi:hypothetical protein
MLARYRRMKNGNALDLLVQHEHKGATRREKGAQTQWALPVLATVYEHKNGLLECD